MFYDGLGFPADYTVDADIEYPGDGNWGMPVVEVSGGPTLPTPSPVAIIRPVGAEPWVLAAGFSGVGALYGAPDPAQVCVVDRYDRVVFVNVRTRDQQDQGVRHPVHVAAAVDYGLLLIAEADAITAIGADGIRWRAAGLVGADLHITRSDGERVYFRGVGFGYIGQLRGSLDTRTGALFPASR